MSQPHPAAAHDHLEGPNSNSLGMPVDVDNSEPHRVPTAAHANVHHMHAGYLAMDVNEPVSVPDHMHEHELLTVADIEGPSRSDPEAPGDQRHPESAAQVHRPVHGQSQAPEIQV